MIYSISGILATKEPSFAVVEAGGVGFKLFVSSETSKQLPSLKEKVFLFTHLYVREDGMELYGFASAEEVRFFEMLISVSGVGPKSALAILGVADLTSLAAAIKEGRPDLLTRVSGIGRKTAERVIVELKGRVQVDRATQVVEGLDSDADVLEMLVGLGYRKDQVAQVLRKLGKEVDGTEARIKAALKVLSGQS